MPVEGQWQRIRTPLRRREKLLLALAGTAAVATALVAGLVFGHSEKSRESCLLVRVPSTMGGATLRECGAAAHDFCRRQAHDAFVAQACRKQGYAAELP
jgi:hypothetical protein